MPARDCVWRQPSDADCGQSIQLSRKFAGYWVNSVEQGQVRPARGHNPNSPKRGGTPAPGALPPIPPPFEMKNEGRICPPQAPGACFNPPLGQGLVAIGQKGIKIEKKLLLKE